MNSGKKLDIYMKTMIYKQVLGKEDIHLQGGPHYLLQQLLKYIIDFYY